MPRPAALALLLLAAPAAAGGSARTPADLAAAIDARLGGFFQSAGVTPAPAAGDAEFLRRVYLDVVGRTPTVTEARTFLDDASADKRGRLVEALLASPGYPLHAARVWRALLVPQATANLRTQHLGLSVEAWVRAGLRAGHTDARITRDLLTTPLDYLSWTPDKIPAPTPGLSPVGFYQANDLKPETVAAAVGRTFLGLKLECAQCHDHPFDKWTRQQAWETVAFFAGVAPLEPEVKPAAGLADRRSITITDTTLTANAKFLDGTEPKWSAGANPRRAFAEWLTKPGNPYFAPVMANRVWARFFGSGIVDPADDWGRHNEPSHPELLADLASAYAANGFDEKFLVRAITASNAYQRASRRTHPTQDDPRTFSRMAVKGLSAEQLFDSLAQATGYRDPVPPAAESIEGWPARSPRGQFIAKFGGGGGRTDMQVSILQALTLMNGEFVGGQTDAARGAFVKAVAAAPFLTDERRVETLFLATLSRRPTAAESARYLAHLKDAPDPKAGLGDVLWVLVNSQEFLVNR